MSVSPNLIARTKAWKALPERELGRLGSDNKTSEWMLPVGILETRTRGKKKTATVGDDEENCVLSPIDLNAPSPPPAADGGEDPVNNEDRDPRITRHRF